MARVGTRSETKRIHDRKRLLELLLEGHTVWSASKVLKISRSQASRDRKAVFEELNDSYIKDADKIRARQLEKLRRIQEKADKGFDTSGEAQFLRVMTAAVHRENELLAAYPPKRQEITGKDGAPLPAGQVLIYLPDNERRRTTTPTDSTSDTTSAGSAGGLPSDSG